jgi:hypothetical protein
MRRSEHGATMVYSVIDNEEIIVARKHVFVDAVKSPFMAR